MLRLIQPTKKYKSQYIQAIKELSFLPEYPLLKKYEIANFEDYIKDTRKARKGHSQGVPRSEYWLMNDDTYIGKIQIRHLPSGRFPNIKSHVFYEIRPSMQRKGYGNKILSLGLKKAKGIHEEDIIVTCRANNHASRKIIEHNNGILIKKEKTPEGVFLKYSIRLS